MIELLTLVIIVLIAVLAMQRRKLSRLISYDQGERLRNDEIQKTALEMVERLAGRSTLNATEITEAITEQNTVLNISSDIWEMPLPYGKWETFPDEKGRPPPEIRGFWVGYPGRLIGVRMPKGSEYDMHSHPWSEILIGGSGIVWVEVEGASGEVKKHRLAAEDVVIIPPGSRHAVLRAESEAVFVCIWGKPKK